MWRGHSRLDDGNPYTYNLTTTPKDNKFLATARQAQADYLVTEDEDLLVLTEYEGTKIITAQAFLALLHQEQAA
jgi:predicted nucleic acid-binding protein